MRCDNVLLPALLFTIFLTACPGKKDGAIEGRVSPAGTGIQVAVLQAGTSIAQTEAGSQDGGFRITLAAGTYDVRVSSPTSPYPLLLTGIVVKPGETTSLAPVSAAPLRGTGKIAGTVLATGAGARVQLLADGIERASTNTGPEGRYEFEGLPVGQYTLQASTPGYATESNTINVQDEQKAVLDIRMLYITAIEGIDWNSGKARARGIGLPPKQAPTPTVRRELAKRAALLDAERNMVRILELINVSPDQKLTAAIGQDRFTQKLSGYLHGYRIAAERDMDGGKIEVEIEVPLTGPGGLSSSLQP